MRTVHRSLNLLIVLCVAQPGCSSKSTPTEPVAAPTHFAVFTSDRNGATGAYRNFFTDLDGAGATQFVLGTAAGIVDRHPSITADGNLLVFQSSPGRNGSQDVFGFNRGSGGIVDDDNVNTSANETDPYVSLNGHRVAFVRDTLGLRRIRLYDTQTQTLIPLTNLPGTSGSDWQPALDELGARIAFVSDRNGNADVFVYDVSAQSLMPLPLLVSPGDDIEPSVSGDGRFVGFASDRTGGLGSYDLYLLDLNSNLLVTLTANTASSDRDPSVSYDGTRIHFVSDRAGGSGGRDLWLYNRTDVSVVRVTNQNSPATDFDPVIVWK